ncbi:MAG: tetratricopeptide repeat protein [Prevotella sp.]|nr:tetratricopeptide repeat protein [Prevotella sp.]
MRMNRICIILLALWMSLGGFAQTAESASDTQRAYSQYFLEAMVQRQKGNNDAAFDLLRHCLELNPEASEAYYYLAQYYAALKDADRFLAYVKRAAELAPGNRTYMETLAQAYIRNQDFASAIPVIEELYEQNKEQEGLLETLFQLHQQVGDYASAVAVLDKLEQIDGKSERLSLAKSEMFTQMGNKKAAVAEMESLAKQYPNDQNYLAMYGETLMMNGQVKKALAVYDRVLAEDPDNSRVLMLLRTYHQSQEHAEIADSLTERLLLSPNVEQGDKIYLLRQEIAASEQAGDSTRVLNLFRKMLAVPHPDANMAVLYAGYMSAKQMPKDSIRQVLDRVLEIAPENGSARLQLVGYAWEDDNMDKVIDLCREARLYNPDEMAFYYYQGMAYYRRDSLDAALSAFQNGIGVINEDSDPTIVSDFYAVMGDILHQKGLAEEAFAAYDSCLQWKEDNIGCLNNYAYYLSEMALYDNKMASRLGEAEQMSYKTVKAEPKNATYLDTYAWILFMEERYAEAKIYIDQALQNLNDSVGNAVIIEHAGDIYAQNKDIDRALEFWDRAQQQGSESPVLIRKIKLKKYLKE